MNIWVIVLRFVHILAGVIWGGGSILMEFFIARSIVGSGEAGQKFAQYLMNELKFHKFMTAIALSTVIAGALLYWNDSSGLTSVWMKSGAGIGFTIGAIFGLIALVSGAIFGGSNAKLGEIGAQINSKPTNEQLAQIDALQKRIKIVSPIHISAMILALTLMATSRYLVF